MMTRPADVPGRARPLGAFGELATVVGGKIITVGSLVLCNVIVARTSAAPAEYGLFASGIALVLILDGIIGFPLDISTLRFSALHERDTRRIDLLHSALFRTKVALGVTVFALVAFGGEWWARMLLGAEARPGVLRMTVITALTLLMVRSTAVRLQLERQFTRYAAIDALQAALRLICVGAAALLLHASAETFLAAYALGTALTFAIGLAIVPQQYLRAERPPWADVREAAVHASLTTGIVVLGTLTGRADVPFVASQVSADAAGQYAVALQIATLLTLLASYGSVVMQPRVIQMVREHRLLSAIKWNFAAAAGIVAALGPVAFWLLPRAIPAIFGPRYGSAPALSLVLLAGTAADLVSMPILMIVAIQMAPRATLVGESVIAAAFFAALGSGAVASPMAVAWTVTTIRFAKLTLYAVLTADNLRRNANVTADAIA